jgi:heme/copper-type cytochrome/quinol oxidase subunit 3
MTTTPESLYPTTREPIPVAARRARVGIWLLIVADVTGTLALIVSYTYLWSLNVNGGWAPPGAKIRGDETGTTIAKAGDTAFADVWPFWAILGLVLLTFLSVWWGTRGLRRGNQAAIVVGAGVALLVAVVALVAQWVQISTFPFALSDGAYASAVFLLCGSNIAHLLVVILVLTGAFNRARRGHISVAVPYQAGLVTIYLGWIVVAFLLGALVTTFLLDSPNTDPAIFGSFTQGS